MIKRAKGSIDPSWTRLWMQLSILGALIITVLDAALLQRKHDFFTGGFLSATYARNAGDILGFVLTSLLADLSLIAPLSALALRLSLWARLRGAARGLMVLAVALSPLAIADFLFYRLATYLGDMLNLETLFQLTGKSIQEILAVAWPQLLSLGLMVLAAVALLSVGLKILNRFSPDASPGLAQAKLPLWPMLARSGGLLLLALSLSTFARLQSGVLDKGMRPKPSGRFFGMIVAFASDFDRDGYGFLSLPEDPAPFNPKIFPYALEVPGNGVDENGVGGDLPLEDRGYSEPESLEKPWRFRPNIVFIMLESFRADTLGAFFEGKPVTPVLDRLAKEGLSVQRAYSHNGYTVQSRHHVFSGSLANLRKTSLIDDFKANGYQVAYFSGQDESFGGAEMGVGFERADVAFDARMAPGRRFTKFSTAGSIGLSFKVLLEQVKTFLEGRSSEKPLFLYVNFIDTHFPYHHDELETITSATVLKRNEIEPGRIEELRAMYLNAAANIDAAIGSVIENVELATGTRPAVIVTADHGESLFDEGFLGHGYAINEVQTRIPLIISGLPMRIREPFGQSGLRESLSEALSLSAGGSPSLESDPEARVFQYTGSFRHPTQIGLSGAKGRLLYHFKTGRVQRNAEGWQKPEALDPGMRRRYLGLVHLWERMVLAQEEHKAGK